MISLLAQAALAALPFAAAAPQYGMPPSADEPNTPSYPVYGYTSEQQTTRSSSDWASGAVTEYPIHNSCNGSETALLRQGLAEAEMLAQHAKDHIQRFGNASTHFQRYFGAAASGEPAGWFDKVVNGDKAGVLFRCDDPDKNCATQEGWAGHWRGENGTDESVICELSYTVKMPLAGMCSYGYNVASHPTTFFFGSDLIHRLFHTDKMGEGVVGHYADTYDECLELALDSPEEAVRNSASLRYFALDVWAYDIAVPGEGCTGEPGEDTEHAHGSNASSTESSMMSSTESSTMTSSSMTTTTTTASAEAQMTDAPETTSTEQSDDSTATTSAPSECHTHEDGVVHCV